MVWWWCCGDWKVWWVMVLVWWDVRGRGKKRKKDVERGEKPG